MSALTPPSSKDTSKKNGAKRMRIIMAVLAIGLCAGVYALMHMNEETTDDASIEAHVVTLAPKVSGYVKMLNVKDNQFVKAGDVIIEIDPTDYQLKLERAQATLAAAQAALDASGSTLETTRISAPSNLDAAQAQVESAQANFNKASNDLKRMQSLSNEARSKQQLDETIAAEKTARSTLEDAKAKLRSAETAPKTIANAEATTEQLAAQVKQAQSDLAQAEKDLADTKVLAPMDGHITKRGVEQGDYVQPGQSLGSLVGTGMWVIADYKETQLKHMQKGQKVLISVDAYPSVRIEGVVDSIQYGSGTRFSAFPPENATGNYVKVVQRVPVKITFTLPQEATMPIGPGMSVTPIVYTR